MNWTLALASLLLASCAVPSSGSATAAPLRSVSVQEGGAAPPGDGSTPGYAQAPQNAPQGSPLGSPQSSETFQRRTQFSLAFASDAAVFDAQFEFRPQTFIDAGLFFSDDEIIGDIGLMRIGRPSASSPLEVGAGIAVYGGSLDDPNDYFVAIPIKGYAAYTFQLGFPLRVIGDLAYAPDATTYGDGDELIDARVAAELGVTDQATITVGYRFYEVGVEDGRDAELLDGLVFGVRLGL